MKNEKEIIAEIQTSRKWIEDNKYYLGMLTIDYWEFRISALEWVLK